jgi:acyl-CoA synthetase (AMP-forming)/AMP-acid ligase II
VLRTDGRAHWQPLADEEPRLRALTCGELLDEAAARWPEREALVYCAYADDGGPDVRWSFAGLRERSREVARALMHSGIGPGERVALWATNVPEWLLLQFGCAYAGVVLVPLNPLYRTAEVAHVLQTSGAATLFVEPSNRGASLWELAIDATTQLTDRPRLVAIGRAPDEAGRSWDEFVAGGAGVDEEELGELRVSAEAIAQIQFTSGTTGAPKGAMLRHGALTDNARLFASRAQLPAGGACSGMPQFHCGGSVLATMGSMSVGATFMPLVRFDARKAIDTIDTEVARTLMAVPTMLLAIEAELERDGGSLASLERVVTGGSLVPQDVARRWNERFGVTFSITYGLTEASPVITQSSPGDTLELQVGTVGRALPNVEYDVADVLTGEPVALGGEGEVRVRGWQVMEGYFGDPAATADAITADGWLRTGDLGCIDEDGYLRITGRAKDMIIRGGENLYPAEIEAALRALDGVVDACVVGVPDERYGEVPAAFVRAVDGAAIDGELIRRSLQGRIARFKIPAHIRIVDAYPLTASGKIQKFKLREEFLAASVEPVVPA